MSNDHHAPIANAGGADAGGADAGVNDEDSRVDARSAVTVLAVTVFGFLLFISGFDGALGVLGLL